MGLRQDNENSIAQSKHQRRHWEMRMLDEQRFGERRVTGDTASLLTTADAAPIIPGLFWEGTGMKGKKVRKILLCVLGNSMGFSSRLTLCKTKHEPYFKSNLRVL